MGGVRDWEYQSHPIFENQVKIKQSIESMSAIFLVGSGSEETPCYHVHRKK